MPIAWFTVLQNVPWTEVIRNAPKVADGAKKLWSTISKKPRAPEMGASSNSQPLSPEHQTIAALQIQVTELEAATANLHEQMLASSELIKALADQNTQLIKRSEAIRIRLLWLSSAVTVIGIIALSAFTMTLVR